MNVDKMHSVISDIWQRGAGARGQQLAVVVGRPHGPGCEDDNVFANAAGPRGAATAEQPAPLT